MSATELDLPVLIAAEQIRRREFVTIRRGYDPDQVRDYLEQVADQVGLMESMIREARLEADSTARSHEQPRIDPYEKLASRISGVIRSADEAAEQIRREAQADAERELREARTDADRIRTDAQARAEEARSAADDALARAREQADRTISGLASRRDALVEELAGMQERLLGIAAELERTIEVPEADTDEIDSAGPPPAPIADSGLTVFLGEAEARSPSASPSGTRSASQENMATTPASRPNGLPPAPGTVTPEPLVDPAYEELWEGTEAIQLEVPDIPPLDLDWGDDGDDDLTD